MDRTLTVVLLLVTASAPPFATPRGGDEQIHLVIQGVSEASFREHFPWEGEPRRIHELQAFSLAVPRKRLDAALDAAMLTGAKVAEDVEIRASSEPDDPLFPRQWGLQASQFPRAWDDAPGSRAIHVAVLDSGIDSTHPDLVGAVCRSGQDYTGLGWEGPLAAHGTHVAGILAATTNNALGIAGAASVCLVDVRVLDSHARGQSFWLAQAIVDATDAGVDIISMSLGGHDLPPVVRAAIQYAHQRGVLLVAAAGNHGCQDPTTSTVDEPAQYPNVVAVASVARHNGFLAPSASSSCGLEVDLSAPGEQILTTLPDGGYEIQSGTSMSVPHVAAAAAILKSLRPSLTADTIVCLLVATSTPIPATGWYGAGMLDAARAVSLGRVESPSGTPRCTPA